MLMQGLQIDKAGEATGAHHAAATLNMLVVRLMRTATAASRSARTRRGRLVSSARSRDTRTPAWLAR